MLLDGQPSRRASTCTGCDIKAHVDHSVSEIWAHRYAIDTQFEHVLMSDVKDSRQKFLQREFGKKQVLCGDMQELSDGHSVTCINAEGPVPVPDFSGFGSGFPCISRTPLSSKMKANLNCAQEGLDATGSSVKLILGILDRHAPDEVTLECVVQLLQLAAGSDESDADWIVSQLQSRGLWSIVVQTDAADYASFVVRNRLWWEGIRDLVSSS